MKWLKILGIVIVVLIIILISVTIVVENKITDASERGYSEGQTKGYEVGYEVGREEGQVQGYEIGYQEGSQAGYQEGKEKGYDSGYKTGFDKRIGTDYLVRNPTYSEVQEILAKDKTYSAEEININAEAKGIRAAYVWVGIAATGSYRIVAFETIDKGLIFIDPQLHKEVKVEIGKRYSELIGLSLPDWDDTITKITIIW